MTPQIRLRNYLAWLSLCWVGTLPAADSVPATPDDWLNTVRDELPTLRHQRAGRWPLVIWQGLGYQPLSRAQIEMLLARGIVQHLRPEPAMLPAAEVLQEAGSPIILMAGSSGSWPYELAGESRLWAHQYPAGADIPQYWRSLPSPPKFAGWAVVGEQLRTTMRTFRAAKVTVDAVWLDYEGEPSTADYHAARRAMAGDAPIPRPALTNEDAFHGYRRQLWSQLLSAYIAAPIREIFPAVSVTNWVQTLSAGPCPVLDWHGRPHPAIGPTLFSATNPVAYGIDTAFNAIWTTPSVAAPDMVDWIYAHILLRQVSADACNRARHAPYMRAIAWIARRVVDDPKRSTPAMSRPAYREILRHLWLRGVSAMQVFNPHRPAAPRQAMEEVTDAQQIYDEMLFFGSLLEHGRVMTTDLTDPAEPGVLWSGVIDKARAVVRVVNYSSEHSQVTVPLWDGRTSRIPAPFPGRTFLIRKTPSGAVIKRCTASAAAGVSCE